MTIRTAGVRGGDLATAATAGFLLVLLVSCASGGQDKRVTDSPSPPPTSASDPATPPRDISKETVTVDDHRTTVRLRVGEMATLSLVNPVTADPEISEDAVRLVTIVNVTEAPTQQWEMHALRPGTARITATDGRGRRFVLTVDVQDS